MVTAFKTARGQDGNNHIRIGRVDVFRSMADCEPIWRAMETASPLATRYQTFELLDAWQTTIGHHEGASPFIVVAYDTQNHPVLLLPLSVSRRNGVRIARFMGGKHCSFNMPIWQSTFAASATKDEVETIVDATRRDADGIDVLALTQQPKSWRGIPNPLALLAGQPSPDPVPSMTIVPNTKPEDRISSSTRRRLRNKERKLSTLPGYRYFIAETDADIHRLLDAFFILKPLRMELSKLPDVFGGDATNKFIRSACTSKFSDGRRAVELHALECDDEIISIFSCVADGRRFSTMFNTYTTSQNARYSPGLILLREMIDRYCDLGYIEFDFGVGASEYKIMFCKEDEPVIDSFIPLTARGTLAALGMSSLTLAKRLVKHSSTLTKMAHLLRNKLHG